MGKVKGSCHRSSSVINLPRVERKTKEKWMVEDILDSCTVKTQIYRNNP